MRIVKNVLASLAQWQQTLSAVFVFVEAAAQKDKYRDFKLVTQGNIEVCLYQQLFAVHCFLMSKNHQEGYYVFAFCWSHIPSNSAQLFRQPEFSQCPIGVHAATNCHDWKSELRVP